jgi:glucose-6-phosphate dehydrogenase assembly protein OpcA
MTAEAGPAQASAQPTMRWSARAHSIAEIERELAHIWARKGLATQVQGDRSRHIAARTSVMNLVVIARTPELAERGAALIEALSGRHPSRSIVVQSADPDGPSWIDARVEARCLVPHDDVPESCSETIHLTAGGDAGRHLAAIVTPLVIHDLPVAIWWPGEPRFSLPATRELLAEADRLIVDGSAWAGDGLERLREMAGLLDSSRLAISDFALDRQSRWREAIASVFDDPEFLPYLRSLRRIAVTYATHAESGSPGSTNIVKPVYHVAWLASRLGLRVRSPLRPVDKARTGPSAPSRRRKTTHARPIVGPGLAATLSGGHGEVAVVVRPVVSDVPSGTTLRVELLATRRGSELRADVTAEAEHVHVRVWQDGVEALDRTFLAARRNQVELLAEAIETGKRDIVAIGALQTAARLVARPVADGP